MLERLTGMQEIGVLSRSVFIRTITSGHDNTFIQYTYMYIRITRIPNPIPKRIFYQHPLFFRKFAKISNKHIALTHKQVD